jgi:hypothetical protein
MLFPEFSFFEAHSLGQLSMTDAVVTFSGRASGQVQPSQSGYAEGFLRV